MRRLDDAMISRKAGKAVLIGAGKLGRALLDHKGFENYGMEIVAAFDSAAAKQGQTPTGKHIFPMEDLKRFCDKNAIRIGVLTVPAEAAQETADRLVEAGVSAIWCFAPARIELPEHVLVRYENLAASLAALSGRLDGVGRPVQSSLQQGKNLA
jgi:redox-sensing transcriptional repressor